MFELIENVPENAVIKVVGVGGGGGNAVKHMIENDVDGVDFSVFASCYNKAGNPPRSPCNMP